MRGESVLGIQPIEGCVESITGLVNTLVVRGLCCTRGESKYDFSVVQSVTWSEYPVSYPESTPRKTDNSTNTAEHRGVAVSATASYSEILAVFFNFCRKINYSCCLRLFFSESQHAFRTTHVTLRRN